MQRLVSDIHPRGIVRCVEICKGAPQRAFLAGISRSLHCGDAVVGGCRQIVCVYLRHPPPPPVEVLDLEAQRVLCCPVECRCELRHPAAVVRDGIFPVSIAHDGCDVLLLIREHEVCVERARRTVVAVSEPGMICEVDVSGKRDVVSGFRRGSDIDAALVLAGADISERRAGESLVAVAVVALQGEGVPPPAEPVAQRVCRCGCYAAFLARIM